MEEYTVIKKGKNIQPCINLPDKFNDMELEIKIRPLRPVGNVRNKLELLFKQNEGLEPFKMVQNANKWQQELRSEWD